MSELLIPTYGPGLTEITGLIAARVPERQSGLLTVFVLHTSCSLLIQENADPDVQADLAAFFARLVPHTDDAAQHWITHRHEGPDDMPAHIKASLLPTSLSVPVEDGHLVLGQWQGIYLFEHRDQPHQRRIRTVLTPGTLL